MTPPYVNIHTHRPLGYGIEVTNDAVGEIGLDYFVATAFEEREAQKRVFATQLEVAQQRGLPVVLHCVRAFEPTMDILRDYRLPAVIFHGFIGSRQQAQRAVERGYYLSLGARSFASPKTVEAVRHVPLDRIFLETDDDDTPIADIYNKAAEVLGVSLEELKRQIYKNYQNVLG